MSNLKQSTTSPNTSPKSPSRSTSGQARSLLNLKKKNLSALTTFLSTATNPGNSSERRWVQTYGDDRGTFFSFAKWAQTKLTEASQLCDNGALPKNLLASLAAQLSIESLPRLESISQQAGMALDGVLRSAFILTHNDAPTCSAAATLLSRPDHEIFSVEGAAGFQLRLNLFLACPTYHDHVRWLWAKLKRELALRPGLEVRISARSRERVAEARAMESACDRWANMKTYAIFYYWLAESKMDNRRHLLGKFMFYMLEIKPKEVFRVWKDWYRDEKRTRERSQYLDAKAMAEKVKAELEKVRKHSSEMQKAISVLRKEVAALEKKLEEGLATLLQPARQSPGLCKIARGLGKPFFVLRKLLEEQAAEQITETFRVGEDTLRLAPLYTWRSAKREGGMDLGAVRTKENTYDDESDYDEEKEEAIRNFVPGLLPSKEFSEAFHPFLTRPGQRSQRWANNLIRDDWINTPGAARGKNLWRTNDDMKDVKNWKSIARSIGRMDHCEQPEMGEFVMPARTFDDFFEKHPEVPEATEFSEYLHRMNPVGMGRYIDQEAITGSAPPKSEKEIAAEKERLRKLAARQNASGIIVHVMSKYMGMRIHVMDSGELKQAALMAELFSHHYRNVDLWDGFMAGCRERFEGSFVANVATIGGRIEELLLNCDASSTRKIGENMTIPMWIAEYHPHETLRVHGKEILVCFKQARAACNQINGDYLFCLEDRQNFRAHLGNLVSHTWQGMCTTVLSRRVRTEEDIDDGTYTTVQKVQFANEFKRLGVLSEEVRDEQCAEMKKVLKMRIRDLKRIFQFYAAAGDGGPATSMDHSEFWKFVKDCKLQKDRKALPSVRVDLIFQCCNLDYSLVGKERMATDDGELDAKEFIEGLARLAVYRYTKGTVAERLNKLIDEDILPNACSVDTDVFREKIASDRVKDIFAKHKHNFKIIYKVFAADDDTGDAALANDTMNNTELVSFFRDFEMIGPLLSERAVKVLFAYVQQDEEALDDEETGAEVADSEMVYAEFVESQAAIGCQMRPDPYNVYEMRIDHFISQEIMPRAHTNLRFRGKGLKKLEKPEGATGES